MNENTAKDLLIDDGNPDKDESLSISVELEQNKLTDEETVSGVVEYQKRNAQITVSVDKSKDKFSGKVEGRVVF